MHALMGWLILGLVVFWTGSKGVNAADIESRGFTFQPSTKWRLDYDEKECRMVRTFTNGKEEIVLIMEKGATLDTSAIIVPGKGIPEIKKARRAGSSSELILEFETKSIQSRYAFLTKFRVANEVVNGISAQFDHLMVDAIHDEQTMHVSFGEAYSVTLEPAQIFKALSALEDCHNSLLSTWGIEPGVKTKFSALPIPKGNPGEWIRYGDFPLKYLDKTNYLETTFLLDVSHTGLPVSCKPIISSGNKDFDEDVCNKMKRRAKFDPALDAENKPVAGPWISAARFFAPK